MSDQNPIDNPPADAPKSDPPTPPSDPAPTPPAPAPNKQESDDPLRAAVESLTETVGGLVQSLASLTDGQHGEAPPEPDSQPVKRPWHKRGLGGK